VFTIPVALGLIRPEDRPALARGVLAGVITIPLGAFAGGLTAGFPVGMLLRNLIPIVLLALLIALGLWRFPNGMVKGFSVFGRFIIILITAGLAAAIIEALTGLTVIPGMASLEEGYVTVGGIAIVLAGAFPLVYVITKVFQKPLGKLGGLLGVNDKAAAGLVATLANNIPMFGMLHEMDGRGKVVNVAFAVSAAFVFGDHLGFTAGFDAAMLFPMIVGKLVGGVTAVAVAMWITRKEAAHG
jgi:ethanolamine transporter